ncbi:hypothetical protein BB560_004366 [Smittium megazygosporum]|uniref:Uncharacterized protein n=1 Tax=Smittium megazygosporum TaxID=133381 RepID=A0A2T9Z9K0_9FUNG|nr:hypothetical protein BB560_004366 [Smittium megazygosporum]
MVYNLRSGNSSASGSENESAVHQNSLDNLRSPRAIRASSRIASKRSKDPQDAESKTAPELKKPLLPAVSNINPEKPTKTTVSTPKRATSRKKANLPTTPISTRSRKTKTITAPATLSPVAQEPEVTESQSCTPEKQNIPSKSTLTKSIKEVHSKSVTRRRIQASPPTPDTPTTASKKRKTRKSLSDELIPQPLLTDPVSPTLNLKNSGNVSPTADPAVDGRLFLLPNLQSSDIIYNSPSPKSPSKSSKKSQPNSQLVSSQSSQSDEILSQIQSSNNIKSKGSSLSDNNSLTPTNKSSSSNSKSKRKLSFNSASTENDPFAATPTLKSTSEKLENKSSNQNSLQTPTKSSDTNVHGILSKSSKSSKDSASKSVSFAVNVSPLQSLSKPESTLPLFSSSTPNQNKHDIFTDSKIESQNFSVSDPANRYNNVGKSPKSSPSAKFDANTKTRYGLLEPHPQSLSEFNSTQPNNDKPSPFKEQQISKKKQNSIDSESDSDSDQGPEMVSTVVSKNLDSSSQNAQGIKNSVAIAAKLAIEKIEKLRSEEKSKLKKRKKRSLKKSGLKDIISGSSADPENSSPIDDSGSIPELLKLPLEIDNKLFGSKTLKNTHTFFGENQIIGEDKDATSENAHNSEEPQSTVAETSLFDTASDESKNQLPNVDLGLTTVKKDKQASKSKSKKSDHDMLRFKASKKARKSQKSSRIVGGFQVQSLDTNKDVSGSANQNPNAIILPFVLSNKTNLKKRTKSLRDERLTNSKIKRKKVNSFEVRQKIL